MNPYSLPPAPGYYPVKAEVTASRDHNEILSTLLSNGDFPLIEKYKKELDQGFEKIHRTRVQMERRLEEETLKEKVYQEALSSGDVDTAVGVATTPPEQTDYALEKQGIDNLIIKGGQNVQEMMLQNPQFDNYLKNSSILQTFIDKKKQEEVDTQSWGDFFFDMAVGLLPVNIVKEGLTYGFNWNIAKQKADEFSKFINLPSDEFEKRLPEFWAKAKDSAGWFNSDEGKAFSDLVRLNRWNSNSFFSADNLAYLDVGVLPLGSMMRSSSTLLRGTGNTRASAQVSGAQMLARVPQGTHNALPGVLQAAPAPNLSIATPTGYALQANPQFSQMATNILARMDRLYKQADPVAVENVLNATRTQYGTDTRFNSRIIDVQYDNQFPVGDPNKSRIFSEKVNIDIGESGGLPFTSVTDARLYIQNTPGLMDPQVIVRNNGSEFVVRVQGRPYEAGSIQKFDLSKSPWLGKVASFATGKKLNLPDSMFGKQLASDTTLEFARNEIETLDRTVAKLTSGQLQDLEMILKKGSVELNPSNGKTSGVWYDLSQLTGEYNNLFGRNPTKKEIDAYFAVQAKSDISWLVRNEVTRRELAFNNYKAYKSSGDTQFLVKDVTAEKPTVSVVDWRTNRQVDWRSDPNVKILRFSQPQKFGKHKFKHAVVDGGTTLDELPDQVVSYNPGGPRGYQGDHFLKQVNTWKDPGSGKTVVDNPRVLSVFVSKQEAKETADKLNMALESYRGYEQGLRSFQYLDNEINTLFQGRYTTQDLLKDIADEKIDPRFKVEVSLDNAVPTEQNALVSGPDTYSFLDDSTPNADILAKQGQLYFSERGDVLTKFGTNDPADIVSPLDMIHRSTDAALRSGAYWNYRLSSAGSWFESLKAAGYPVNGPDALRHIMGPDIDVMANGKPRADLLQLRNIQRHFKSVFNPPDALDSMIAQSLTW
jgi:hypothetical protein